MSWLWPFHSYSQAAFGNYLGGGHVHAVDAVITAATWNEDAWDDVSATERRRFGALTVQSQRGAGEALSSTSRLSAGCRHS